MGGSSKKVTVGYKYYLGAHLILCHGPLDKVTKIEVDGKTAWSGAATGGSITIAAENLFGGEEREGGVSGVVDIEMGAQTQGKNSYLQSQLGTLIPAYRRVAGVVLRQVYIGLNPYLKRWAFWASRIHVRQNGIAQWYDAKAEINGDMNPAHIIRECLTDPDWGMGYPEADINDVAFQAAADQLFNEGMGMSLLWDRAVVLEEFIQLVLKHIEGSLYVDRATGLFVLKLARGGYNVSTLLVLDESSIEKISNFKRGAVGKFVNSVTVVYWDAAIGKNNSITVQDTALATQQSVVGTTQQFPGFTNGAIAARVAARSLKAFSTPLVSGTIYANRKAAALNVGDVFILNWPRYGVSQLAMRVVNIELGSLESNAVKIQAIEDVFALPNAIYSAPPPSGWTNPNNPPAPCLFHNVIEAPYWELVQRMGETAARDLPATSGYVIATGVRPSGDARNAKIYTNPTGSAWEEAGTLDFCPTAVLTADIAPTDTLLPIGGGIDLDFVQPGTHASLGTELIRIDTVSSTQVTVARGVLDTVAKAHLNGARLFFSDVYFESDGIEYAQGEAAQIRLLPSTGLGTLALNSAVGQPVTIVARQAKPYPPGKFRINNVAYPFTVRGDGNISISWAHRDRLQQTASLIGEEVSHIGPEVGTTYTCEFLSSSGSLVVSHTALAGNTDSFTLAEMGANYGRVRIRLWSVRNNLTSHQIHDWEFTRSGYGAAYGYSYGGT